MLKNKIHPAEKQCKELVLKEKQDGGNNYVLTVWKRSSMSFQGTDGFTVFDPNGKLVFRVDNYSRKNRYGVLLMDGVGNALLTLKPQMMSTKYEWNAYGQDGNGENGRSKIFTMRSASTSMFNKTGKKVAAEIFMGSDRIRRRKVADFKIEGSFRDRNCKIKSANGEVVAAIARKRVNTTVLLSDDVFSLFISQPGLDSHLIMAFIIILDRISNHPFSPLLCS